MRRGANAVEFALLLPVFLVLVGGSMELSWLIYQQGAARTAVSRGCRAAAMVDPGPAESTVSEVLAAVQTEVIDDYRDGGGGSCPDCTVTAALVGAVPNRSLQCTFTVPYVGLTALLGPVWSGVMTDEVIVRLEYQRRTE